MRDFCVKRTKRWTGKRGRVLRSAGLEAIGLLDHLESRPGSHMTGVYYVTLGSIAELTGVSIDRVNALIGRLSELGLAYYDDEAEEVWLPHHAEDDVGAIELKDDPKKDDNRVKALRKGFKALVDDESPWAWEFYQRYRGLYGLSEEGLTKDLEGLRRGRKDLGREGSGVGRVGSSSEGPEPPPSGGSPAPTSSAPPALLPPSDGHAALAARFLQSCRARCPVWTGPAAVEAMPPVWFRELDMAAEAAGGEAHLVELLDWLDSDEGRRSWSWGVAKIVSPYDLRQQLSTLSAKRAADTMNARDREQRERERRSRIGGADAAQEDEEARAREEHLRCEQRDRAERERQMRVEAATPEEARAAVAEARKRLQAEQQQVAAGSH